jgi:hypothetical protein
MALVVPKIKKDLEAAIMAALTKEFAKEGGADPSSHKKLASAIAEGVAMVLIKALQTEAEVLPGIGTAGSPAAQTSVTPGKIF